MPAKKLIALAVLSGLMLVVGTLFVLNALGSSGNRSFVVVPDAAPAYASDFSYLSQNGNSNCSKALRESIASMPDGEMLRGSCCGPMSMHVYSEQRRGMAARYAAFPEIPADPYNIPASVAKR